MLIANAMLWIWLTGCSEDVDDPIEVDCPAWTEPTYDAVYEPQSILVDPTLLDARADLTGRKHLVFYPGDKDLQNELVVVFPGSNGDPTDVSHLGRVAAFYGHRTIILDYPNSPSESEVCADDDSGTCQGDVFQERIYGEDTHDDIVVDGPNSVMQRLETLLGGLAENFPNHGWGTHLDDQGVVWSGVVVVGGSQGGKISAYISRDLEVAGAALISGTGSVSRGDDGEVVLASWTQQPRATGPERVHGLWHEQEAADEYAPVVLASYGVDAFGPIVDTDNEEPPYECTHMLRSNLLPATGDYADAHSSMGIDDLLALDSEGVPLLAPAWGYIIRGSLR
jgi:hypothetical protein